MKVEPVVRILVDMAPQISRDDTYTLKLNQWGLLLSVCTYGAHIALFSHCVPPLVRQRKKGYKLLAYVLALFSLSTAAIALQIWWSQVAFIDNYDYPGGSNQYLRDHVGSAPNMVLTGVYLSLNWLVDGLLLYRFNVLWGALWPGRRTRYITLVTVGYFIGVIVTGCVFYPQIAGLGLNRWTDMATAPAVIYLALSYSLNVTLMVLIIWRVLQVRWTLRQSLGKHHGKIYTSIVALIIESASLYVVVALMSVISCGINSPMQYALLPMLGQLQAIPPLLITSRVAEGKGLSNDSCSSLQQFSKLEFGTKASSSSADIPCPKKALDPCCRSSWAQTPLRLSLTIPCTTWKSHLDISAP
ncbi:hypothetical protein NM688_g8186 [Phlebia brevispora]|uniref:Uncharacterized protein n=1 Tax=Phlebia brevispora TaxID=194682 RepID=A0ACC1RW55_9APHY|nr:hypothetical protein NM688_g8186 [Phlebia brevispora]